MRAAGVTAVKPADLEGAERALWDLRVEIRRRDRDTWTVDDRNALMALDLYFDEQSSYRGDRVVLDDCSAPDVRLLVAQLTRAA